MDRFSTGQGPTQTELWWAALAELQTRETGERKLTKLASQTKDRAKLIPLRFLNKLAENMGKKPAINWQITG